MIMRLWRLVAIAALALVGACSAPDYWRTDVDQEAGSGAVFDESLRVEYTDEAQRATAATNWPNAAAHAKKAAQAKTAYPTWPDHPDRHKVPVESLRPLTHYYDRMERTLHYGADKIAPQPAAVMQVSWDCWLRDIVHRQAMEPVGRCGSDFLGALEVVEAACNAQLEAQCGPQPVVRAVEPARDPQAFIVFFGFDSAVLSEEARLVIRSAVNYANTAGASQIELSGHTDRSGNVDYNLRLSQRRVEAVRDELVRLGIASENISLDWRGEARPMVNTGDGVREGQNRRVEILLR